MRFSVSVSYFTTKQQEVLPRTKEKKPQFYRKTVATYVGQVLKLKEIGLSLNIIYPISKIYATTQFRCTDACFLAGMNEIFCRIGAIALYIKLLEAIVNLSKVQKPNKPSSCY